MARWHLRASYAAYFLTAQSATFQSGVSVEGDLGCNPQRLEAYCSRRQRN
jgi:hypothetical protein